MASADELKALGNKAIADKNFDAAMYVHADLRVAYYATSHLACRNITANLSQ